MEHEPHLGLGLGLTELQGEQAALGFVFVIGLSRDRRGWTSQEGGLRLRLHLCLRLWLRLTLTLTLTLTSAEVAYVPCTQL